jgi:alpha-mannosidase
MTRALSQLLLSPSSVRRADQQEDDQNEKGHEGWTVDAPKGQCLGEHEFEYSIIPHCGGWEESGTYVTAHEFSVPTKVLQVGDGDRSFSAWKTCLRVRPRESVVLPLKKCEFEEGLILRFLNTTAKPVNGRVRFGFPVKGVDLARLDEKTIRRLELTGDETTSKSERGALSP